jgi:hypothetical protein
MHERRGRRAAGSDGDDKYGCGGGRRWGSGCRRRRRALRMAVVLWSSGVWGRSCVDGSPGRRRRAEVGRGVLRGNSGDAGNGKRAVKVLGMRRSERRAVTVGVGAKVPRGTEKGGAGATHGPRAAWWVCRRDGRRRIRDVGHEIDHRRMLRMGVVVLDRCQVCAGVMSRVESS